MPIDTLLGSVAAAMLATAVSVASGGSPVKTTDPLVIGCTTGGANNRAFTKFTMPTGVASSDVRKAVLRIYEIETPDGSGGGVTLQRVASSWTDTSVTYGQSLTPGTITNFCDPSNLDWYTDVDVTSWVKGWLSSPSTNYGLCLYDALNASGAAKYFDSYYGVTAPQLIMTVPEPGGFALLIAGLLAFSAYAWKKRR